MKRFLFIFVTMLMTFGTFAQNTVVLGDINNDGVVTTADVPVLSSMILEKTAAIDAADVNGDGHVDVGDIASLVYILAPSVHGYVDLGLPSGTLWATCNVGANSPEEYGDYFAWGETTAAGSEKTNYTWGTYKWMQSGEADWLYINKYQIDDNWTSCCWYNSREQFIGDGKKMLETADDAATANWGEDWQMPSYAQCQELVNSEYTTSEWMPVNNIYGRKITSLINGNSIFFPATGRYVNSCVTGATADGYYWSRMIQSNTLKAGDLVIYSSKAYAGSDTRYYGCSVRPVRAAIAVSSITLSETYAVIEAGTSATLTYTVLPLKAANRNVTWTSSDESIATVSASGEITGVAKGEVTITATAADGNGASATCTLAVIVPNDDTKEYVDLGLPSGTLWATCNVGAKKPEDYGDYFAWGETTGYNGGKTSFGIENYKWMQENRVEVQYYIKYQIADGKTSGRWYDSDGNFIGDGMSELLPIDDAATMNWGSEWQMPSGEQEEELINKDYTTISVTTLNGINGQLITSKINSNSIFLPIGGYRSYAKLVDEGEFSYYWARDLYNTYWANRLDVDIYNPTYKGAGSRPAGYSVRPVFKK